MNLRERSHSKLSDDELVNQFDRKSLNEKLELFKRVLRKSHQTFSDLIKAWIHDTPGDNCHGPLRQRKAKQIVDLIWQDENGLLPLFEKTESFNERVATSTVKVIRSKLDVLNTSVKAFVDLVGITFLMYAISGLSVLVRTIFTSFRKPANRQSSSKGSGSSRVDFKNASKGRMLFEMIGPSRQPSGPHQSQLLLGAF